MFRWPRSPAPFPGQLNTQASWSAVCVMPLQSDEPCLLKPPSLATMSLPVWPARRGGLVFAHATDGTIRTAAAPAATAAPNIVSLRNAIKLLHRYVPASPHWHDS